MKNIFAIVVVIIISILIHNLLFNNNIKYVGYFYPDKENMEDWSESDPLNSLTECQDWVNNMIDLYEISDENQYDYVCGKDCKKEDAYNQGVSYTCRSKVR